MFDKFKVQCTSTSAVFQVLRENIILVLFVPANCTNDLQPSDISINQSVKYFLSEQFQAWYADQGCSHLQSCRQTPEVDLNYLSFFPHNKQ